MKKSLAIAGGLCTVVLFAFLFMLLASKPSSITYTGQSAGALLAFNDAPAPQVEISAAPTSAVFPAAAGAAPVSHGTAPTAATHTPKPAAAPAPTPTAPSMAAANPLAQPPVPLVIPAPSFGYQYAIPTGAGQGGGGSAPAPVVVPDTTAPVIAASADVIVEATSSLGAYVSYTSPTAIDDVSGSVAVSCAPASGTLFALGTTTVVCSASDAAGNAASTTFAIVVKDTIAPAIAATSNISQVATSSSSVAAVVTYTLPSAADAVDGTDAVSCTPTSGSLFVVGTTTVHCSATDAAGNTGTSQFDIGVYLPPAPHPFTMASQPDDSNLCIGVGSGSWQNCLTLGFSSMATTSLGLGSSLGAGTIQSVTIETKQDSHLLAHPWTISILCYLEASFTTPCTDWLTPNIWNASQTFVMSEYATTTTDNQHWTAYFTDPMHESNVDGSFPVRFNPTEYYELTIDDNGWDIPAYGSLSPAKPYFILTGMTQ